MSLRDFFKKKPQRDSYTESTTGPTEPILEPPTKGSGFEVPEGYELIVRPHDGIYTWKAEIRKGAKYLGFAYGESEKEAVQEGIRTAKELRDREKHLETKPKRYTGTTVEENI